MVKARFIRRLNRFVVDCRLDSGEVVRCHLPNPGRLWELLFPDVEMLLADGKTGKYAYGVLGVKKGTKWVYLHTLGNNDLAEKLIKEKSIAGLEDYRIVRREVSPADSSSRFDFLLEREGEPLWLEVKMCSLFQGKSAMFPDAPTLRGQHHLQELARLHDQGFQCAVLFIVQDLEADFFLPEYHTDPDFARILYENREKIRYFAVGTAINEDLSWKNEIKQLTLPLDILPLHNQDSGVYLMMIELTRDMSVTVGALGERFFAAGWYVYVGSAKKNLTKRVERHLRKRKRFHWHIDYLRQAADSIKAVPIRIPTFSEGNECRLAGDILKFSEAERESCNTLKGFGCSDCDCDSHLFYFSQNPLDIRGFVEKLLYWRMELPLQISNLIS
jgi:sugar fermentation stimulation protein A